MRVLIADFAVRSQQPSNDGPSRDGQGGDFSAFSCKESTANVASGSSIGALAGGGDFSLPSERQGVRTLQVLGDCQNDGNTALICAPVGAMPQGEDAISGHAPYCMIARQRGDSSGSDKPCLAASGSAFRSRQRAKRRGACLRF